MYKEKIKQFNNMLLNMKKKEITANDKTKGHFVDAIY
jgi:hypothetical protein